MRDTKSKIVFYGLIALVLVLVMMGSAAIFANRTKPREALKGEFADCRYPYTQLMQREQELYSALYEGIAAHEETIYLPDTFSEQEYTKVFLMMAMQEPELFYLSQTYETADEMRQVKMYYDYPAETCEAMQKQIDAVADTILSRVSPVQTDGQKLLAIHDGIAEICGYGNGSHQNDVYGCLVDGVAKCEGYAKAFLYLARRAGLQVMCIAGSTSDGTPHVWNVAEINGGYYNIDLTWDDDDSYGGNIAHSCFAMPDEQFVDHKAEGNGFLVPSCSGVTETYYQSRGYVLTDASQLADRLQAWLPQSNGSMMEFRCANGQIFAEAKRELQSDSTLEGLISDMTGCSRSRMVADAKRQAIAILLS